MKRYVWAIASILIAIAGIIYGYRRANTPMVSVVMLTYKRADMLPKAIESILAQTYKDFEFIILNDGSPDNTDEVMKKYTDSRIRYYKNSTNKKLAYSRNRATSLARGKYIMIMDDDDISLPERMKQQVEYLESHPEITVLSGQLTGWPRIPNEHNEIVSKLIQYNNIGNANIMYRREFAKKNNIKYKKNMEVGEDWYFWLQMLFKGALFASINDDVIIKNVTSQRYYKNDSKKLDEIISEYVGSFFSPSNPKAFYEADACGKLKMIAPKHIFSEEYMEQLQTANNCR